MAIEREVQLATVRVNCGGNVMVILDPAGTYIKDFILKLYSMLY